jgi:hypothetical protein
VSDRLRRIAEKRSPSSEKIILWHPTQGRDHWQLTVTRDVDDPESGQGETLCEAITELEAKLGILPPPECDWCGEMAEKTDSD